MGPFNKGIRRYVARHMWLVAALLCTPSGHAAAADEARLHWAFQPVQRPAIPRVRHIVESPVDAFILEKLEAAGLEPAAATDKRTLLRRASYDLIGLPPTPAEVADFLADQSPDAFTKVVDRLLASPHYGERWGRHWLDAARYANTKGDTGGAEPVSPYAFTYRDYVIRAFNDDLPYDRFLIEQIAADQLEYGEGSPALAALGFITVGRRFLNNVHDTIDDRIDVVTRGAMGLTVSCARCHDHKYDPIPTRDYYSLYGVFANSIEPDRLPVVGSPDPAAYAEYQSQRQEFETRKANYIRRKEAAIQQEHRKLTAEFLLASRKPREPDPPMAPGTAFADISVQRAGARRWRDALGNFDKEKDPIFAPWFAFAALADSDFADRARELSAKVAANSLPHSVNPLVGAAFGGDPPASLSDVAGRYARLFQEVAAEPDTPPRDDAGKPPAAEPADPARLALRRVVIGDDAPGSLPQNFIRQLFPPMVQMQLQQYGSELDKLDARHPGAPVRAMALFDNPHPQNGRVFIRGNPNNPGEEVPRQFVQVLAGEARQPFSRGSGRLELARAIASRDNPLTARALVNRVWQHHFDTGLVTTADDFGLRSSPPSHPELLDYLAARFMDDGWSLKSLHRLLMLSKTYRQASDDGGRSQKLDPENRLLAKMNRRRLDFESMRDTLLAVAGNLDRSFGGRPVELTRQAQVNVDGSFGGSPTGKQSDTRRRTVYGFIDRQNLPGFFRVFDFPDPDTSCALRYSTTVPQQALFFLNGPLVMEQAAQIVGAIEFQQLDPEGRIPFIYSTVFQRVPSLREREMGARFIATEPDLPAKQSEKAGSETDSKPREQPLGLWERYAQTLLMSNELMFVD